MASLHLTSNKPLLSDLKECAPIKVKVADSRYVSVSQVGTVHLRLVSITGKTVCIPIKNVYYHPTTANLLSVGVLEELGWVMHTEKHNSYVLTPSRIKVKMSTAGRIHVLKSANGHGPGSVCNAKACSAVAVAPSAAVSKLVRLHESLNHMGYDSMQKLLRRELITDLPKEKLSEAEATQVKQLIRECRSCLEGKGHRTAFGHRGLDKGTKPGEVIHMDSFEVKLPADDKGERRREYGLVAEAAWGQWRWSVQMSSKDEGPQHVIDILRLAQTQFECKVKRLHIDGGTEFITSRVKRFCKANGIEKHWPPAKTEQLRGIAERGVRTVKEDVRTLLRHGSVPLSLWRYACNHAIYVWNRSHICKDTGVTPYETKYHRKPSQKHLGVFGCDAFVWVAKSERSTWDAKVEPAVYLGHATTRHCSQVLLLRTGKIKMTRDVTFRMDSFAHILAWRQGRKEVERIVCGNYTDVTPPTREEWWDSEMESNTSVAAEDETSSQGGMDAASSRISAQSEQEHKERSDADQLSEEEHEVQSILKKRFNKDLGIHEYRVHWAGYPKSQATWESAARIDDEVPDRVKEFEDLQQGMARSTRRAAKHNGLEARNVEQGTAPISTPSSAVTVGQPAESESDNDPDHEDTDQQVTAHMVMSAVTSMQTREEQLSRTQLAMAVKAGIALLEKRTPSTCKEALSGPDRAKWSPSMQKEMDSCEKHGVWELVDRSSLPAGTNILPCKWVYRIKTDGSGDNEEFKSRVTPKGCRQKAGKDYNEVFAPTGKYKSMRVGLSLAAKFDHELEQLDVPTAFLRAPLDEVVYMEVPEGFRQGNEGKVCKLKKALYGLKQAPRQWNITLTNFLTKDLGLRPTVSDPCLLFKRSRTGRLILFFEFVDDFQGSFAKEDRAEWNEMKAALHKRFSTKDLGESKWILGMRITRDRKARTITLDQELYITKALEKFGLEQCRTAETPEAVGVEHQTLSEQQCQPADAQRFMEIVGTLMYAAISTRPDIAHAVHYLASNMREPTEMHMTAAMRVLRYLAGTPGAGLVFGSRNAGIVGDSRGNSKLQTDVCAWADADWANDRKDRKSITGWVAKLNGDPISWSSKKQRIVAQSTCEAELYAEAAAIQEVLWLRGLLAELGLHVQMGSLVHGDNQSTIAVSKNGVRSERTKHIDVKYHFITETVESGQVKLKWVPTTEQQADIFTKALPAPAFLRLRNQLMRL